MEHLSEIKPNTYAVNLATFEEIQLAKRKKKHTETGKKSTTTKTKKTAAPPTVTDIIPEPAAPVEVIAETQASAPPVEVVEVMQEPVPVTSMVEPRESAPPVETAATEPAAAPVTAPAETVAEPAMTPAVGDTVVIQHTRVSYDDGSRLYTIESNGEFYDAGMDLDRVIRTIRALAPDAAEEELALLKLL